MIKIIAFLFFFELFQFSNGNPPNDEKIVNGEDAKLGQFPHQVLWARNGAVMCGGSIYNKSTIITAAHCCKPFEEGGDSHGTLEYTNIVAGRVDIYDTDNGQEISIESYLIHPDYNEVNLYNDICLLTLDNDLTFNDNVKAIALNNGTLAAGTKCIVSGWGTTKVSSSVAFGSKLQGFLPYLIIFFSYRVKVILLMYFNLLNLFSCF